jgi:2-methylaconitate cis-trans-isomerase PrpF
MVYGASPVVFVNAEELGLKGTENSNEIDSNPDLLNRLEAIRGTAGVRLKFIKNWRKSREESPVDPFVACVSQPTQYVTFTGEKIEAADIDIVARMMFMQQLHKTYPASGSLCTGIAAVLPGTLVNEFAAPTLPEDQRVRIGHPGGVMEVESAVRKEGDKYIIELSQTGRTARRIMEGFVYVK